MITKTGRIALDERSEIRVIFEPEIAPEQRPVISDSASTVKYLNEIWDPYMLSWKERFYVLYLDRKNGIIGHVFHSQGTDVACLVSVKQIMAIAIKTNACGIILAHNHPSGNSWRSKSDLDITRKVKAACETFDIRLLDHIILTSGKDYYSFADKGEII